MRATCEADGSAPAFCGGMLAVVCAQYKSYANSPIEGLVYDCLKILCRAIPYARRAGKPGVHARAALDHLPAAQLATAGDRKA